MIKKFLKINMLVLIAVLIVGCASNQKKYEAEVLTTIPNQSMIDKTYALYPLDEMKIRRIETQMFVGEVVKGLTETGLRLQELNGQMPSYIIMFDYATEIGLDAPYEHVFLMIAYDVTSGARNQVYKVRLKLDSKEKNPLTALSPAIQSITKKFPNQFQ